MARIFTIGHSTRTADAFLELLTGAGVRRLVDVRRFPGSRRFPQFSQERLGPWLGAAGIEYLHEIDLGGRRKANPESRHVYWENASFRAYADYMETAEFQTALERLTAYAAQRPTAIMCSEAVPWRCHRRLIADALIVRGFEVADIMDNGLQKHVLNPHARVGPAGTIVYDLPETSDQGG